jgi:hypothetical protein
MLDHDSFRYRERGDMVAPGIPELASVPATMSRHATSSFVGVGCGAHLKTFCITADGILCCFSGNMVMERLVSLEASHGFCLSVTADYVAVGGASAIVRLFDPATLEYKLTLPFCHDMMMMMMHHDDDNNNNSNDNNSNSNHTVEKESDVPMDRRDRSGTATTTTTISSSSSSSSFPHGAADSNHSFPHRLAPTVLESSPAVLGVRLIDTHVIVIYADRSIFVFEVPSRQLMRSFLFHSAAITDIAMIGSIRGIDARHRIQLHKVRQRMRWQCIDRYIKNVNVQSNTP